MIEEITFTDLRMYPKHFVEYGHEDLIDFRLDLEAALKQLNKLEAALIEHANAYGTLQGFKSARSRPNLLKNYEIAKRKVRNFMEGKPE